MGLGYHGRRVEGFKSAIRSIGGVEIRTKHALKGPEKEHFLPHIDETSYRLYRSYAFRNDTRADGDRWDMNYVWLSS
jgi:hypothetical protein